MTYPKVAIIILNWNGWRDTIECLESLQKLTYPNYRIIVVDNGSTDGSVEKIKAWARGEINIESKLLKYNPENKPVQWVEYGEMISKESKFSKEADKFEQLSYSKGKIILIKTGKNLGFAEGNNVGIRYAQKLRVDYYWLLNNDTIVDSRALETLIYEAENNAQFGILGSKIYNYYNPEQLWFAGAYICWFLGESFHYGINQTDKGQFDNIKEVSRVSGCSMLIKDKVIEDIGFFDKDFFLYVEEVDFCLRARKRGWKCVYIPFSKVYHKFHSAHPNDIKFSAIYTYYQTRNFLYTIYKNIKGPLKILLIIMIIMVKIFLAFKNWVEHRFFGKLSKTYFSIFEGIKDFFQKRLGEKKILI